MKTIRNAAIGTVLLLVFGCKKNEPNQSSVPRVAPVQKDHQNGEEITVFRASLAPLRVQGTNQPRVFTVNQRVTIDAKALNSINSLLESIVENRFGGPFLGYKEYWIIPKMGVVVGILDEGFGMSVWNAGLDAQGQYYRDGEIVKFGGRHDAQHFIDFIMGTSNTGESTRPYSEPRANQ